MSAFSDGSPAAFPRPADLAQNGQDGMSLRDWFAGQALAGHIAAHTGRQDFPENEWCATSCYEYADAMLAARAKERP
jgi:hypothetical protein